jgi:prophage regulatory protein
MSRENIGRAVATVPNVGASVPPENGPLRLLRLPEVISRVGLKRSSIYQRMAEGRFPKARSLGPRCTVWVETEIDAWIASIAGSRH